MYKELYETWKHELESAELVKFPPDFYSRVVEYLRRIREEGRMLDKRTVKTGLLKGEMRNAKRMLRELIQTRYRKVTKLIVKGEKVPSDALTAEEERIYKEVSPFAEAFQGFVKDILRGHLPKIDVEQQKRKRAILRFLKDVPAIIGADMKTYGPFGDEDIASLPVENAKILVKQGLAKIVEA